MDGHVLAWMAAATGHHWVTHGVLDIILFLVLGWAISRFNKGKGIEITPKRLIFSIVGSVVVSGLIIFGFYI